MKRRAFLKEASMAAAGLGLAGSLRGASAQAPVAGGGQSSLRIDPKPLFELSPYLYMQFMEPLGATDGSVEAAWDHLSDQWRDDVVAVTRELGPPMMRWGGIFVLSMRSTRSAVARFGTHSISSSSNRACTQ